MESSSVWQRVVEDWLRALSKSMRHAALAGSSAPLCLPAFATNRAAHSRGIYPHCLPRATRRKERLR
jgi:hypothetical protein